MKKTAIKLAAAIMIASAILTGAAYAETVTAKVSSQPIKVDGQTAQMTAYSIGGNNYVKLRDIGKAVDFGVSYDAATRTVYLDSSSPYIKDGAAQTETTPSEAAANLSDMPVVVDGNRVSMTAYLISGSNYVKLRDIGRAVNFGVTYDDATRTVHIDSAAPYVEEAAPIIQATGSGRFSSQPIKERWLSQGDLAREDYSRLANPAIFDATYTRGMYNAIYQTMLDKDLIIPGNNENGFNVYYDYAQIVEGDNWREVNKIVGRMNGLYSYESCGDPAAKETYKYPNYSLVKVYYNKSHNDEVRFTENVLAQAKNLATDRERVVFLNDFLCEIMEYSTKDTANYLSPFYATKEAPYRGACGSFARAFNFLCDSVDIPCVTVVGEDHVWNAVYIEGKWLYVDVSANDNSQKNWILLTESYTHKAEEDTRESKFTMELLVPNSTVK